MNIETKIEVLATIVKDLLLNADPEDIDFARRHNMLKDLDRILADADCRKG